MVSVHLECGRSGSEPPKTRIGICDFSAKYYALRRNSKDLLALNQDNVPEWGAFLPMNCCFSELALYKSN